MTKKTNSLDKLKKLAIIVGLISSVLTTILGMGKELSSFAKEWLISENSKQVESLQNSLNAVVEKNKEQDKVIANLQNELNDLRPVVTIVKAIKRNNEEVAHDVSKSYDVQSRMQQLQNVATMSAPPDKSFKLVGWLLALCGIIGSIIFWILHNRHKEKHHEK